MFKSELCFSGDIKHERKRMTRYENLNIYKENTIKSIKINNSEE